MTSKPRSRAVKAVPALPPVVKMAEKVRETVAALSLQPEDVAVAALAVEYAETMDRAAEIAEAAARIPYDPDTAQAVARLKARVEAHTVVVEVGPKLQSALDALGATPKARTLAGKPAPAGAGSKLAAIRAGIA